MVNTHKLLYTSILALLLLLSTTHTTANTMDYYDLVINGVLIRLSLGVYNKVLNNIVILKYTVSIKPIVSKVNRSILKLVLEVNTLNKNLGSTLSSKFLILITNNLNKQINKTGVILVPTPCFSSKCNIILKPKLIVSYSNSTRYFNLRPIAMKIKLSRDSIALTGKCVCSDDPKEPIELCILTNHRFRGIHAYIPLNISLRIMKRGLHEYLVKVLSNNTLLYSRLIRINKSLVTTLKIPIINTEVVGNNTLPLTIKLCNREGREVLKTTLNVIFEVSIEKPEVRIVVEPRFGFITDIFRSSILVRNINEVPMRVKNVELVINGSKYGVISINEELSPNTYIVKNLSFKLNKTGKYLVSFVINYEVLGKLRSLSIVSKPILVLNPIHLGTYSRTYNYGEDVEVEVTAFRPLSNVFLLILRNNSVVKHIFIGDFDLPSCRSVTITNLKPGNYSIIAASNGIRLSNTLSVVIINKTKVKMRSEVYGKTLTKSKGTPYIGAFTIELINSTVAPKSNVKLVVKLPSNVGLLSFKLFRYERKFQPPWILQPLAKVREISRNTYELIFKAPSKVGTYTYRLDILTDKINHTRTFTVRVVTNSLSTARVPSSLLKNEFLYPLIGTIALASILLFRRYSRKK